MKKPITIPNVDIELYEAVKERCKQDGTSISTYFNSLLAGQSPAADESEKIKELNEKIMQLKTILSKRERELKERNDEVNILRKSSDNADDVFTEYEEENKRLKEYCTAKDAELEEVKKMMETLKSQIENLRPSSDDGVFVDLSPLELALINHVSESEQTRHKDNSITPATLLKAMFVNYTIHGDMYFFPHPSKATLRTLKAQIEEKEKQAKEEEKNNE